MISKQEVHCQDVSYWYRGAGKDLLASSDSWYLKSLNQASDILILEKELDLIYSQDRP